MDILYTDQKWTYYISIENKFYAEQFQKDNDFPTKDNFLMCLTFSGYIQLVGRDFCG